MARLKTVETMPCVHCGRQMGDYAGGFAMVNSFPLCHPNDSERPDCYVAVTIYDHPMRDCRECRP